MKATVDAYDGTVTLYEWDEEDLILQTYMKAFPTRCKPFSDMPDELVSHVRYPEDLFKLQRDILTRYHVANPVDFYNQNDRWQVPNDPTQNTERRAAAVLHPGPAAGGRRRDLPADQRAQRVQPGEPVLVHLRLQRSGTYGRSRS